MYSDLYLKTFTLPSADEEQDFFMKQKMTCYQTFYPFQIVARENRTTLCFENVTILYGDNGSGKSTVLNVIAETLGLDRFSPYNSTPFYGDYVDLCSFERGPATPRERRMIVSDDVFDEMFRKRSRNREIDGRRDELLKEYDALREESKDFKMRSLRDYDKLAQINAVRKQTKSSFIKSRLDRNVRTMSNGETALDFFSKNLNENGLYLLDEPENSLSPETQLRLKTFLEDQARFYGCQLIIATHSPFLLSLKNAKIYNLDNKNIDTATWTDLPNVKAYYAFFKEHADAFE